MKLARRKHFVTEVLRRDLPDIKTAGEIMDSHLVPVAADITAGTFLEELPKLPFATHYLAVSDGAVAGVIAGYDAFEKAAQDKTVKVADIAERNYAVVAEDLTFMNIVAKLHKKRLRSPSLPHRKANESAGNVKGIITPEQIGKTRTKLLELLSD